MAFKLCIVSIVSTLAQFANGCGVCHLEEVRYGSATIANVFSLATEVICNNIL